MGRRALSAIVTQLVYMGDTIVYSLGTDEGLELQARELSRSGAVRYTVGSRVTLSFSADTASLLRS